jgi:hypothetical protein
MIQPVRRKTLSFNIDTSTYDFSSTFKEEEDFELKLVGTGRNEHNPI